jgi:hypothetical protein
MDLTVCTTQRHRLVISDHALVDIITVTEDESRARTAHAVMGGMLGAAVAGDGEGLLTAGSVLHLGDSKPIPPFRHIDTVLTCFASEVPEELSTDRKWPKVLPHRRVTFYPRALIQVVTLSWFGALHADVTGHPAGVDLRISVLEVRKARRALSQWAYPLK